MPDYHKKPLGLAGGFGGGINGPVVTSVAASHLGFTLDSITGPGNRR